MAFDIRFLPRQIKECSKRAAVLSEKTGDLPKPLAI